jgi:glutamate-ammonia-ligase adenylyltransferase
VVVSEPQGGRGRLDALVAASSSGAEFLARDARARALLDEDRLPQGASWRTIAEAAFEDAGMAGLRMEKRRRLLQIAAWDLTGELPVERAGTALADLADACLEIALLAVSAPQELAVIALGKLGGRELNYVSDIDLAFVTRGDLDAGTRAAERLLAELGGYAPEGRAYIIDVSLRPEGRSGALVRSLDGALEYYERWADAWEHQALIKARTVAGDAEVGA